MRHDRLRKLREQKDLTMEELGKRIGVSKQAIQKYETGGGISNEKIELLAKALNTTPSFLMGWSDADIEMYIDDNDPFNGVKAILDTYKKNGFDSFENLPEEDQRSLEKLLSASCNKYLSK